jgi:MFS transporter, DHA1 family, tetracycline resistance protein
MNVLNLLNTKRSLFAVFCTVFIDLVGFGLIVPILPILFLNPEHPNYLLPANSSTYYSLIIYGLLLGAFPLAQFLATPILGQLSDQYGRRKIILISLFGSFICYLILAAGIILKSLPLLFFARILGGITGGNIAVAQAVVGDVSTKETSAKNFGLIGGAFGLGLVLGPFLGGHLSSWGGPIAPFVSVAVINLLNMIFVWQFLPETNPKSSDEKAKKIDWSRSWSDIWKAFTLKKLKVILLTSFLYQAGFTFLTTFANPFFINRFGWHEQQIGNFFGYIGIWLVITQAIIIRWTVRFDQRKLLAFSLLASSIFTGLILLPQQESLLYVVAPFFAIFVGLVNANITSVVSHISDSGKQGEGIGVNASVQALAQAVPPILSGFISFGSVSLPIWISVIVIFAGWVVFVKWFKFDQGY